MMRKILKGTLLLFAALSLVSCTGDGNGKSQYWNSEGAWYMEPSIVDPSLVDVFYIASTEVLSSKDSMGNESFLASLTPDEKEAFKAEYDFVKLRYFPERFNFIAPYYHQYTLNSIELPKARYDSLAAIVTDELLDAFTFYMDSINAGRPFIIAGFSQGAQMLRPILENMTDEQYSRMIAAYSIGFGLSGDDLKSKHIKPAQSATDTGVTVSFNTVNDITKIWSLVYNNAETCINPVNWTTTSETAEFYYGGLRLNASVDTTYNVVVVDGFAEEKNSMFPAPWPYGCLHHYDLMFYADFIKENALLRSQKFLENSAKSF